MSTTSSQVAESIGFTSSSLTKALNYPVINPKAVNFENFDEISRAQKIAEILMQALAGAVSHEEHATTGHISIPADTRVYDLIHKGTAKTPAQIIALTDLSRTKVTRILRRLRADGRIQVSGNTKGAQYHAVSLNRKAA